MRSIFARYKDFKFHIYNSGLKRAIFIAVNYLLKRSSMSANLGSESQKKNKTNLSKYKKIILFGEDFAKPNINVSAQRFLAVNWKEIVRKDVKFEDISHHQTYIIFCSDINYIQLALRIRALDWRNRLVVSYAVLKGLTGDLIGSYVDHIIFESDKDDPEKFFYDGGFLVGNIKGCAFELIAFYFSLLGEKRKYKMLSLIKSPKEIQSIKARNAIYEVSVSYDKCQLVTSGCDTFREVVEANNIVITHVTEDIFWLYNSITQAGRRIFSGKDLINLLRKGAFVRSGVL
jgi:hypothetical protein